MRVTGGTRFPHSMAFGAANDLAATKYEGLIAARESRALGIHWIFAPVADVNNNARNPVINIRSYGEDPARVAALVNAYVAGAREGGMIATIKHFPGHGDTDVDSHLGLPVISFDRARLRSVELVPFHQGIDSGAQAVMAAHIELPALDPAPSTPATFSRPILHDLLRQELGFKGLLYTDSMSMDAVARMLPRKTRIINPVRMRPMQPSWSRFSTAFLTNLDWSKTTFVTSFAGTSTSLVSIVRTSRTIAMVFASPPCFRTGRYAERWPSTRTILY
jgi:beta-glucosidase-like glycosyl hydrolase